MKSFAQALYRRMEWAQFSEYHDNYDEKRFGPQAKTSKMEWIRWQGRRVIRSMGFYHKSWLQKPKPDALVTWMQLVPELEWFYGRLADDESRALLVDLVAYRIMGHEAVRLPLGTMQYREKRLQLMSLANEKDAIDIGFMNWKVYRYDLSRLGYPLNIYLTSPMTQFALEQYAYKPADVMAEPGDIVLDGGGCYGDTALYFACKVGDAGQVHVFEFVPSNLRIARKNLEMNPAQSSRVHLAEFALWHESELDIFVRENGPASTVSMEEKPGYDIQKETITIDDYVDRKGLARVDFIKLDIEGAEESALRGAERTIKEMKPKMAVCLYHSPQDFVRLPRLLDQYCPDYKFYLKHATMHAEETVLFAKV
jgi:FkbM family methyltransferase